MPHNGQKHSTLPVNFSNVWAKGKPMISLLMTHIKAYLEESNLFSSIRSGTAIHGLTLVYPDVPDENITLAVFAEQVIVLTKPATLFEEEQWEDILDAIKTAVEKASAVVAPLVAKPTTISIRKPNGKRTRNTTNLNNRGSTTKRMKIGNILNGKRNRNTMNLNETNRGSAIKRMKTRKARNGRKQRKTRRA